MKKLLIGLIVIFLTSTLFSIHALATIITYDPSYIGGNTWEFSYQVSDHMFNTGDSFEILFDYGLYEDITDISHGADWAITAYDPQNIMGFVLSGVYNGTSFIDDPSLINPFIVQFDWLGGASPGSQNFNVYASDSWTPIENGATQNGATQPVPEPATIVLLTFSLSGLLIMKKKA